MTQEEIDAILGGDSSIKVEDFYPDMDSLEEDPMDGDVFDIVKNVEQAIKYVRKHKLCPEIVDEYATAPLGSYSAKLAEYRIVVVALTSNEERHLTTGDRWYPIIRFCKPGKEKDWGTTIVGKIEADGETYSVVGGHAHSGR